MTVSERIDSFLLDTQNGEYWFLSEEDPDNQHEIVKKALSYGLVVRSGHTYELTQKGYEVIEAGGFDNWKSAIEKREDEKHQATLDSTQATQRALIPAWFSGMVAAVALLFGFYQTWGKNEKEKEVNALRSELKAKDSLLTAQAQALKKRIPDGVLLPRIETKKK